MQWLEGSGVATAIVEVATMAQIQSLARNFHMLPIRPKRKKKKKKERININMSEVSAIQRKEHP